MAQVPSFPQILPPVDYKNQTYAVPGTESKGATPAYRNAAFKELVSTKTKGKEWPLTGHEMFEHGRRAAGEDGLCLGARPFDYAKGDWADRFEWQTYGQIAKRRDAIGAGILRLADETNLGKVDGRTHVGIWSVNMPQWQIVSLACHAYSLVNVSLYDTLGPDAIEYCVNHAECSLVFATPNHIPALLKLKAAGKVDKLKVIVSLIDFADIDSRRPGLSKASAVKEWAQQYGITIYDFTELETLGANKPVPHRLPMPEDMAAIAYTSGTTGNPKGAIALHKTLATAATAQSLIARVIPDQVCLFSYMPLSHCYERLSEDMAFAAGGRIGYSCGDVLRLLEDIKLLQPTQFPSVPRVLNRLYNTIKASTIDAPGLKGSLVRHAVEVKLQHLRATGQNTHAFYDRLIFKKVKAALGGNMQMSISGSAPISPEVLEFLNVTLCCDVVEGYGQTEGHATCNRVLAGDPDPQGSCGPPIPVNDIRLADVPDMGYLSTDKPYPRGELQIRGDNVIPGYYRDEEKTKELFTEDGWMRSGDIALRDGAGRFKIIDRIKNLVKLAQGEYVAVEKIDNVYLLCPLAAQVFVYADSLKNHLILFVVPDPTTFAPFVSKILGKDIKPDDIPALSKASEDKRVVDAAFKEFDAYAVKQKLRGFERAKQIGFRLKPFEVGTELTPTMKCKRNVVSKGFKPKADELFAQFESENGGGAKSRL